MLHSGAILDSAYGLSLMNLDAAFVNACGESFLLCKATAAPFVRFYSKKHSIRLAGLCRALNKTF